MMVARQLKWYAPFLNFEVMMLSMLYVLSYLEMMCLSIATSTGILSILHLLLIFTARSAILRHGISV